MRFFKNEEGVPYMGKFIEDCLPTYFNDYSQPTLLKYYNFNNIFGASLDVKETHRDLREVLYSTNTPR